VTRHSGHDFRMVKPSTKNVSGLCRQVAALPWRIDSDQKVQVLLVTSRTNGKWMLPKGWPMEDMPDFEAARIEALEEAGIEGSISANPIGSYHYLKLFETEPAASLRRRYTH